MASFEYWKQDDPVVGPGWKMMGKAFWVPNRMPPLSQYLVVRRWLYRDVNQHLWTPGGDVFPLHDTFYNIFIFPHDEGGAFFIFPPGTTVDPDGNKLVPLYCLVTHGFSLDNVRTRYIWSTNPSGRPGYFIKNEVGAVYDREGPNRSPVYHTAPGYTRLEQPYEPLFAATSDLPILKSGPAARSRSALLTWLILGVSLLAGLGFWARKKHLDTPE